MSETDLEPRRVVVHELRVSAFDSHTGRFELHVRCGGGTYVRTLIVDLARAVGSAAHMTALARTQHGPFCLDGAPAPRAEARTLTPVAQAEFVDAARLLGALGEAQQVLDALDEEEGGPEVP